ncbi:MAG: pilus assembly protein CpaF, partial [Solirubrobacteraceae bacterium]|nr:pilus assembly protein CpaF [Solirubrobacteraceae bacterium]
EALDMLSAMTTGHDGSLSTVHAGSPEEAVRRVETLALMAGVGLPHAAIREQVADAIDVVVHQSRRADGRRRVTAVAEVVRVAGGVGVREVYGLRDDRPRWRAALSERLAGRLAGAGGSKGSGTEGARSVAGIEGSGVEGSGVEGSDPGGSGIEGSGSGGSGIEGLGVQEMGSAGARSAAS